MVKIGTLFIYCMFFILALMYFTPKVSVYYFIEQILSSYSIVVSKENVEDTGLALKIKDASVSIKSVDIADVSVIDATMLVLYNSINAENITLSSEYEYFMPLKVKNINIRYSILDPLNIVATSSGEFGKASASINIFDRMLHLNLQPSDITLKNYKKSLQYFKRSENGEYVYEKNI